MRANDLRISCKQLARACANLRSTARHRWVAGIGAKLGSACRLHALVRPHHRPLPASSNRVSSINHERRACYEACRR
jgi:hypothetical protein